MTVLVEDTPRNNLAAWVAEAVETGVVGGATTSPFSSPYASTTYKPSCARMVEQIQDAGGEVWFDAATYALGIPAVGDFRYYDEWDLWGGARGDVSSAALLRDHVRRVLAVQEGLGVGALAPTVLLPNATGSELALSTAMAAEALAAQPNAFLTIAGTPSFWSAGSDLDAYTGAMAQQGAAGFFLVVVRPVADLPPQIGSDEIAGLCRTARSLSQFGDVHVSHGDFAGIPAVAAGAVSVGTGWDSRQRVCNYSSYVARDPTAGGGGWFQRPTFRGLFSSLKRTDAERFFNQDPGLASRLHVGSLHPDGPKEAFFHHARTIGQVVDTISSAPTYEARCRSLAEMYDGASRDWPSAAAAAAIKSMASTCIDPLAAGLNSYAQEEGWA